MSFLGVILGSTYLEEVAPDNLYDLATLGGRISYLIHLKRTTQTAVADKIGVKPQTIQYLCKSTSPKSRYITDIACALDVNSNWLATGKGTMKSLPSSCSELSIPLLNFTEVKNYILKNEHNANRFITISSLPNEAENYTFGIITTDDIKTSFENGTLLILTFYNMTQKGYYLLDNSDKYIIKNLKYRNGKFYEGEGSQFLDKNRVIARLLESRFNYT
jgi:hypothetical protein